jgi:hypothetical protein
VLSRKGPLAPAAGAGNGFGELAGLVGEAGGVRATGGKTGVARVRPTLKGVGNQLAGADFDLSDVSDGDTQSWELKVVDSEGRTLRTFSGKGNPPKNIKWEGRDESGEIVSTDLSAGYELRVVNDKGAQKVIKQDLVTQSGYAQALKQAVEQAAALPAAEVPPSGAAWKTRCFLDANTGVWRCRFFFKGREARLNREQVADLADLAEKIQKYPKRVVHLHGVSLDPHDGLQAEKLAQERANAVLKNLMETYSLNPRILKVTANDLTARGAKEGVGMSFVETEVCLDYVVSQVLAELKSARLKETSPFSPLREVSKSALKPAPTPGARPQAPEGTQEEEAPSVPEPVSVVKPVAYPTVPVFDPSKEYKPLPIREK